MLESSFKLKESIQQHEYIHLLVCSLNDLYYQENPDAYAKIADAGKSNKRQEERIATNINTNLV